MTEYHDISITHSDGQRFAHFEDSSLPEHIQKKQTSFLVWTDSVKQEYPGKIQTHD